jgi:hypothetical protein
VISLRFGVVIAIFTTGSTPAAGIETIHQNGGPDEIEGFDDALLIGPTLPKFMEAIVAFKNGDCFVDVEDGPFFPGERALVGFVFHLIDEDEEVVGPVKGV